MRASAGRTLPPPAELRAGVTRVAWGVAAEALSDPGPLLALPHCANFGAGEAYLHWSPSIVVTPGTEVSWRSVERGKEYTGAFIATSPTDVAGVYPPGADAPASSTRRKLIADGKAARFGLVASLEKHVDELLVECNRFVARELEGRVGDATESWAPVSNHGAVDRMQLDALATQMLWGEGTKHDSTVLRMVDRAATTSINNQPLGSWFDRNLRPRAEEAIRRLIGDPHIGRKIRRMAREHGPRSVEELLDLYRRAHPSESVGRERIIAALSADKTIDSLSSSLSLYVHVPDTAKASASIEKLKESNNGEATA